MGKFQKCLVWGWNNYEKAFAVGALAVSFAAPAWAAYISPFMQAYHPLSWVVMGFAGLALATSLMCAWAWSYSRLVLAKRTSEIMESSHINPLEDRFERKKIHLSDFYHPLYVMRVNKDFRDCELTGPAMIYIEGGHLENVEFKEVQIVIANTNLKLWNATAFRSPKIIGGVMSNVTLIMSRETYSRLSRDVKRYVPVINE